MLDRKSPPSHAEINSFDLPSPEIFLLKSGIPMFALRGVSQRVIKIELVFNAGKWFESKKAVSYFTAHMLEKGTAAKNSFEIADFFDRHGASVEINPGFDFVSVSLFSLTENLSRVLPVFLELVTASVFPENELILQKDIFNQNLKINSEKTSYVASKLIREHLFGTSHPYGSSIEEDQITKLTRDDLNHFFQNHFSLSKAFIVGSIDEGILNLLISELSIIPAAKYNHKVPAFSLAQNESSEYREKADSVQTSLRLGKRIINRSHPDYPTLVLLNHMLGGYFGSRLMKNIREEKGLTYGIHSSINTLKNDAFFVIAADVNRVNRDLAVKEIKNEITLLCDKLVGHQELQTAKSHLLGSLQLEIANPFSVIEKIKAIQLYGLKGNFYDQLFQSILGLDELALQKTANAYLADKLIEVAVG